MSRTTRRRVLRVSLRDGADGTADSPGDGAAAGAAAGMTAAGMSPAGTSTAGMTSAGTSTAGMSAAAAAGPDMLAVEEPLEIRVGGEPLTVTMRTPGDDIDLAAGFLFCEGIIAGAGDLASIRICGSGPAAGADGQLAPVDANVADVRLDASAADAQEAAGRLRRSFLTTSACGICGKESIDSVRTRAAYDVSADEVTVDPAALLRMPGRLREAQRVFARTGGLHAAGLFTATGDLIVLREDVGRHNAVDKVVGWALRSGRVPLHGCVLLVSGRASFELVQKALMAGIAVLAAVSAPSSLAAELADDAGMTLAGFVRGTSMNIYAGAHRIRSLAPA